MTISQIWKHTPVFIPKPAETSPVVYNGQLLAISTPRDGFNPICIEVRDYKTGTLLAPPGWSGIFGSATTDESGVIHVWGATGGSGTGNAIIHSTLDASFNPSTPDVVYQYPSINRVWNTSACKGPNGWVLAAETLYPGTLGNPGFHIIFYTAPSASGPWTPYTNCFNYNPNPPYQLLFEAYCPTIKYCAANGYYYLFYMQPQGGVDRTYVAKSQTLQPGSWQFYGGSVLDPDGPGNEGTDASDFDYCEFNGKCYGVYFEGSQSAGPQVKRCLIDSASDAFLASIF